MNVAKAEKSNWMAYAEIKALIIQRAKCFNNGKSAAKPRIEEGSTTKSF